ncbi:MAG: ABC transporter permease [Acidobacteriia bacterium]|nr:ABC transporter permease [Terriglobia bacterium]
MKRVFAWWRRRRSEAWQEEIDSHLALRAEWNQAHGIAPEEARRQARRQFGNSLATLEAVRAVYVRPWVETLVQDCRYALRGFRKAPAFSAVAIATIAIGVGAASAVFSAIDPVLFRPLPYPKDEQLVSVGYSAPVDNYEFHIVSSYLDWRQHQTAFQSLTAMRPGGQCDLVAGETVLQLGCVAVEDNFLQTFGVQPLLGRSFRPEEDRPHAPTVLLISYGLWQRVFGGDPHILGRLVTLDEEHSRIVGVLPRGFEMPQLGNPDVLLPARLDDSLPRSANSSSMLRAFARLRDGVTMEQAREQMQPLFEQALRLDVPAELRSEVRLVIRSLRDRQIHEVKLASWMLLGAVVALLLIACANVANLLLARAASRRRELALRAAIGASGARLARQMLTESLVLGLAGGAAGCGVAWALLRFSVRLAPEGLIRLEQARIDLRVLGFALAVSIGSAVLFGMAAAVERPRAETLAGSRAPGMGRTWFRKSLVAAQVALSLMLLAGASLFLRSLWKLENQPLGFRPERLVTASFTLRRHRYQPAAAQAAFFRELEARLASIPGAGPFAVSDSIPPRGSMGRPYSNIRIAGHRALAANGGMVAFRRVTPGYFQALGISILAGRPFTESDRASGEWPVILSATLARRMFGNENPIGQRIALDGAGAWSMVVGVAADAKNNGISAPADPEYYRLRMNDGRGVGREGVALFRSGLDPASLTLWIRRELAGLDPTLPVTVETMETRVGRFAERPRFVATLVALFAGIGLLLAGVGLYGVLSFLVSQRTQEIGVRMALGAQARDIALQVQGYAAVWTGIGVVLGLAGALALTRTVRGLLYDVVPGDPISLSLAVMALAAIAALAAWIPAHRAARVDPVVALRQQ